MRFALCNELCVDWDFARVCCLAADAGFDAVEIAPYTLAPSIDQVTDAQVADMLRSARHFGVQIVGLHWLLAKTTGLHINTPDDAIRQRTIAYLNTLIRRCRDLEGSVLVLGSPGQRSVPDGQSWEDAFARTVDTLQQLGPALEDTSVTLCFEPLARSETNFINTAAEAVRLIQAIEHPSVKLILDCKAMADESIAAPELIHTHRDLLAHFHANDDNRSYPGTGSLNFPAIMGALHAIDYAGYVSIEVFDFTPPLGEIAARGLAHLKASLTAAMDGGTGDGASGQRGELEPRGGEL